MDLTCMLISFNWWASDKASITDHVWLPCTMWSNLYSLFPLSFTTILWDMFNSQYSFTHEETEAQRVYVTYLKSHG